MFNSILKKCLQTGFINVHSFSVGGWNALREVGETIDPSDLDTLIGGCYRAGIVVLDDLLCFAAGFPSNV
jgi:hypothetical protein